MEKYEVYENEPVMFHNRAFSCIGTGRMDLAASQRIFRPVKRMSRKRLDLTISVVMDFSVRTWQFIRNLLRRMVP